MRNVLKHDSGQSAVSGDCSLTSAAALVLAGLLGLYGMGCKSEEAAVQPRLRPVRFMEVAAIGGQRDRAFSGVTYAGTESKLSFKVPGQVRRLNIKLGDRVNSGDLIAELDPTDFELQLQQARASLVSASAMARNASSKYRQVRALYENGNAPKSDLDSARASHESASAQVRAGEKQVQLARQQLGYARLKAPLSGSITQVLVEANENVGAGRPVVHFASGSNPEVTVAIPEGLISEVQTGQDAQVTVGALAGRTFEGRVSEVGAASTRGGATFPVTVTLSGDVDSVKPGMAAEVTLKLGEANTAPRIVVPLASVGEDRTGRFVFLLEKKGAQMGVVKRKPVTVGEITGDGLEIRSGVEAGDLLVTAGVSRISDGLEVKVPEAS